MNTAYTAGECWTSMERRYQELREAERMAFWELMDCNFSKRTWVTWASASFPSLPALAALRALPCPLAAEFGGPGGGSAGSSWMRMSY
jgi:hypothetical protein